MRTPIPIRRPEDDLNNSQKRRLRRGVLFPVLAFLGTIALLVAGTYFTATHVDNQQQTTGAPTSDQNKGNPN